MKLLPSPMKVLFPLKPYLWQLFSPATTEKIYNPCQFWCSHRRTHLERCWNWKKERVEELERCWQQPWNPKPPLSQLRNSAFRQNFDGQHRESGDRALSCALNHQPVVELKWRGVSYFRPAINLAEVNRASITPLVTSSADDSKGRLKDSDCQPSSRAH